MPLRTVKRLSGREPPPTATRPPELQPPRRGFHFAATAQKAPATKGPLRSAGHGSPLESMTTAHSQVSSTGDQSTPWLSVFVLQWLLQGSLQLICPTLERLAPGGFPTSWVSPRARRPID